MTYWVPTYVDLPRHPKTRRLARALGVGIPTAVGHLVCLWSWCMDFAGEGDLANISDGEIADAAEWSGDATAFVSALEGSHWLDTDRHVHDWDQYGGKVRKEQERRAAHMREVRSNRSSVTRDGHVRVTLDTRDHKEQNRTEQSRTELPLRGMARARDDAAAAASPPPPPASSTDVIRPGRDVGATSGDVDAVLDAAEEATGRQFPPGARPREATAARRLLEVAGSIAEAAAYLAHRVERGQSPELKFAARDYTPRWRQGQARASPARGGMTAMQLLARADEVRQEGGTVTHDQALTLVALLKGCYPTAPVDEGTAVAFAAVLADVPYPAAKAAALGHARQSKWFPAPKELLDAVASGTPRWKDAGYWSLGICRCGRPAEVVAGGLRRCGEHSDEALEHLQLLALTVVRERFTR